MAFWNKSKARPAKHSIIEVIKYDGPNDILIWKFPNEEFNTNTQLVVGPSQEAIFIKGGQVLGRFVSGTYTLDTKNYPFIRALVGLVTGSIAPFQCSVYYVNKVVSMGIDWGTDTPISVVDPIYHVPINVRTYGDFSVQVENGQKLMEKLVGTANGFSQQEIQRLFGNMMNTQVRGVISETMIGQQLSPIGIDAHLAGMSQVALERVRPIFEPYGMTVHHFTIAAITAPELEEIKGKALEIQGQRMETDLTVENKRKMAQAQSFENKELNVTEQQKMAAQIGETLAGNPGPMTGNAGGMGFGGIVGGTIVQPSASGTADIVRMIMNQPEQQQQTPNSSDTMPGGMSGFEMMEEAAPQSTATAAQDDFKARADKLQYLLDTAKISKEQYDAKMMQMLDEI